MARVALYPFGIMREEWGHPVVSDFEARTGPIYVKTAGTSGALHPDGTGSAPVGTPKAAGAPPAPSRAPGPPRA